MDNKQLYHIAGEVIVVAGLSMYFMKQLKIQKDELKELRDEVKKHQDQTNKNLEMIYKILDKAFGINTQPILNQTSNENKDQSNTESKNKEDPRSSKENFKNSSPQIIQQEQSFAVPMMSMLAMTNPLGFGIVPVPRTGLQETQLRHRNRPPQTEIQIVDEQSTKMNGQGFTNKTSMQIQDNFDSDNDDEIMEELIELERPDEDENEDENVHQETSNDNQTFISNEQSDQSNQNQEPESWRPEPESWRPEEVQEKPFYPEPSKKKKISKKQT
jgi:hypothetical protein